MLRVLPHARTYLPGPGRCIYCPPEIAATADLTREHIIARKLGGELILHDASCGDCARTINQEIESPMLTRALLSARAHLGLPSSRPPSQLRLGRWSDTGEAWPKEMKEADFRFENVAVPQHPFVMVQPHFSPPGMLIGAEKTEEFTLVELQSHMSLGATLPSVSADGTRTGLFEPFSPDITCRFIAKIAHGAAVAELGLGAFHALLPDVIMGRSKFISYLVGSSRRKGRRRIYRHRIMLDVADGLLIAEVQLFAQFGFRAYQAVVGPLKPEARIWHRNVLRTSSTPRQ